MTRGCRMLVLVLVSECVVSRESQRVRGSTLFMHPPTPTPPLMRATISPHRQATMLLHNVKSSLQSDEGSSEALLQEPLPTFTPESLERDEDSSEALLRRPLPKFPPQGGMPLAEGVIRLSPAKSAALLAANPNKETCLAQLNKTCFGQCLQALRINQFGPLVNLTSLAEDATSPYFPVRGETKERCDCPHGVGVYHPANGSAVWAFPGTTPPRMLNVTTSKADGVIVVRHMTHTRWSCPYVYDIASGVVMGVKAQKAKGGVGGGATFPVWATVLIAIAGVLVLSSIAFVVIKTRSVAPAAAATTSSSKKAKKKVRIRTTLRDPLLQLSDEEEGAYTEGSSTSTDEKG